MYVCVKRKSQRSPWLFIENPTSVRCSVSLMVTVLMATGLLSASQNLGVDQLLHSPFFSLRDPTGAKGHGLI